MKHFAKMTLLSGKIFLHFGLILCIFTSISECISVSDTRAKRSADFEDDDTSIRTELVDRNNRTKILAMFNLTEGYISRNFGERNANNKNSTDQTRDDQYFEHVKQYRINDIKNRLQSAFQINNSEESQEHPLHEMAAYPICNTDADQSAWFQDNNVTIRFSDSLFEPKNYNLNLDSAILRLYKVNPNNTDAASDNNNEDELNGRDGNDNGKPKRCADPMLDAQIRVTVSIVQQLRRNKRVLERKKRICNTIMMNISKTGWVEIDIKRAIYIWENFERQENQHQVQQSRLPILVGWLLLEVHDDEERPLKPGLFFQPPKCDQADLAIPWNYYRPHASMPTFAAIEVPRYPRLDVKMIGYASFAPKNSNKQSQQKEYENLRRQFEHLLLNSAENDADESTTSITPTADNYLESRELYLHNHHKRQSYRFKRQHQQYPAQEQEQQQRKHNQQYKNEQQQIDSTLPTMSSKAEQQQQKHEHTHAHAHAHRHRRHHRHHHHQQ